MRLFTGRTCAASARRRDPARGQSLVEFALVLPVLLIMMMIALDFGRVYLGYVNLQNLTRIAANFAANDADAWQSKPNATTQNAYRTRVLNDAAATNCDLPGNPDTVAPPVFTDQNGDGDSNDLGDLATVQLTCSFSVITPGVSAILGPTINVSAESVFPIKSGLARTAAAPGGGASVPTAAFSGDNLAGPAPHIVRFRDESGGMPTSWSWDFGDGETSTIRDPQHTYAADGVYDVTLVATNSAGSGTVTKVGYITVGTPGAVDFTADRTSGMNPLEVQFTDTSTGGPTAWLWDFGDGTAAGTTQNPKHMYTTVGSFDVTLTVTTPTGAQTVTKPGYITVATGLCTVPDFIKTKWHKAQDTWARAKFTTTVVDLSGPPVNDNFTINFQSLTGNSQVPCGSTIELDD